MKFLTTAEYREYSLFSDIIYGDITVDYGPKNKRSRTKKYLLYRFWAQYDNFSDQLTISLYDKPEKFDLSFLPKVTNISSYLAKTTTIKLIFGAKKVTFEFDK